MLPLLFGVAAFLSPEELEIFPRELEVLPYPGKEVDAKLIGPRFNSGTPKFFVGSVGRLSDAAYYLEGYLGQNSIDVSLGDKFYFKVEKIDLSPIHGRRGIRLLGTYKVVKSEQTRIYGTVYTLVGFSDAVAVPASPKK